MNTFTSPHIVHIIEIHHAEKIVVEVIRQDAADHIKRDVVASVAKMARIIGAAYEHEKNERTKKKKKKKMQFMSYVGPQMYQATLFPFAGMKGTRPASKARLFATFRPLSNPFPAGGSHLG